MKAERDIRDFVPIFVTIETEEEASLLWHLMNITPSRLKDMLIAIYGNPEVDNLVNSSHSIYSALSEVYKPKIEFTADE